LAKMMRHFGDPLQFENVGGVLIDFH